jgi:FkbM family methyltransferase
MHSLFLEKQIDLVDFGSVKLLMFKNDNLYDLCVSADRKGRSLREHYNQVHQCGYQASLVTPQNSESVVDARHCLSLVLAHFWRYKIPVTILDIGAFIGDFSIQIGNLVRTFQESSQVYAFDPTEAGYLIPYNIEINGLQCIVCHKELAVSDYNGYTLFTVASGMSDSTHAEDKQKPSFNIPHLIKHFIQTRYKSAYLDKLIRYLMPKRDHQLLAPCIKLVDWLHSEKIETSLFVKLDIEGADIVVLRDLISFYNKHYIACVFEFNPNAFDSRAAAIKTLKQISLDYFLLDIWYSPQPAFCHAIEPDQLEKFVDSIATDRVFGYTDILIIPKQLPDASGLRRRLVGLKPGPLEYAL